jgi:hypothetical protein
MATRKKKSAAAPLNAVEAEKLQLKAAHHRAVRALRAAVLKLARNEITLSDVHKVKERAFRAYNKAIAAYDTEPEIEAAYAMITAETAQVPAAEESGRAILEIERAQQRARWLDEERFERQSRYVPGLGYVQGKKVIG